MSLQLRNISLKIYGFLLLTVYMVFTYSVFNGWWYSSVGTILIIFFSYLIWREKFLFVTGLKLSVKTLLLSILLGVIITFFAVIIIRYIGSKNGVNIQFSSFGSYYHDIFYVLNEEIILGGIAIYLLISKYKLPSLLASVLLALAFSVIHYVFYRWVFLDTGIIKPLTLIVLFLVGFVRNNLIIVYRHIGFSWALHFGWVAVMLGSYPYRSESLEGLSEPEKFNMFLGSREMLIIAAVLAVLSYLQLARKQKDP